MLTEADVSGIFASYSPGLFSGFDPNLFAADEPEPSVESNLVLIEADVPGTFVSYNLDLFSGFDPELFVGDIQALHHSYDSGVISHDPDAIVSYDPALPTTHNVYLSPFLAFFLGAADKLAPFGGYNPVLFSGYDTSLFQKDRPSDGDEVRDFSRQIVRK